MFSEQFVPAWGVKASSRPVLSLCERDCTFRKPESWRVDDDSLEALLGKEIAQMGQDEVEVVGDGEGQGGESATPAEPAAKKPKSGKESDSDSPKYSETVTLKVPAFCFDSVRESTFQPPNPFTARCTDGGDESMAVFELL